MLPLNGLTVLALEQAVAAPYCTVRLADAGARVIKVERQEGDFARNYDSAAAGTSSYFAWLNRGKQSLVADIKDPDDAALLHRMMAGADVFIQNLAPGAAARSGFGSAELRSRHPRLITVDISGYGEEGPYASMKAYDLLIQAESGLAGITGHPAGPGRVGVSVCDIACGLTAYSGVLESLIARGIDGEGQSLCVSLFDAMADWMTVPLLLHEAAGAEAGRPGLAHPSICPYGAFSLADGAQMLLAIQNEREWAAFCTHVLLAPDFATNPGACSNNARVANRALVDARVAQTFGELTQAEARTRLQRANPAFGVVRSLAGLAAHPALRRMEVASPNGLIRLVAPPVRRRAVPALRAIPSLGEHSDELRKEFAA